MADFSKLAEQMVAPIYNQLESNANDQISKAENDPYYNSLLQGLEATKNREFSGIESRALQRGVGYGNIPSQQQGVYLGEKYLPAVAEVKKTQLDRINALKQTLAELRAKRAQSVLDQVNIYEDRDFKAREAEKDRALTRGSASYYGGGAGTTGGGVSGDSNGDGKLSAEEAAKMMLLGGETDWGRIAKDIELEYPGSTKSGGAVDKMLRSYFIGPETRAYGFTPLPPTPKFYSKPAAKSKPQAKTSSFYGFPVPW